MSAASRLSLLVAAALWAAVPALGSPTLTSAQSAGGADERGWTVHVDNDLFAFADEDRDYTAGVAFTLGGDVARAHTLSLEPLLTWIDRKSGFDRLERGAGVEGRALEFGLTLFTPNDLGARHPVRGDRPYANLLYVSSSKLSQDESGRVAYQSSLTLGVLGLPFAGSLHRAVHDVAGGVEPMGYANQISAGGEPTARYSVARYALLGSGSLGGHPFSVRFAAEAGAGYLTDASVELALHWGPAQSPWWSAPPVASDYAGHPLIRAPRAAARDGRPGLLIDTGIKLRARLYNSLLQGQFRDSALTYDSSELEHLLVEAWFGVTATLPRDLSISYTLRYQSEELENGPGAHGFTWASISIAQRF